MTEQTKQQRQQPRRLLRTNAAGEYVGSSAKTIRKLIVDGRLPYVQLIPGGPFLVDVRDLDALITTEKNVRS